MSYFQIPHPKNLCCIQYPCMYPGKVFQSGLFHADPLPKLPKGPVTRDSKPAETKFLHDATLPGRGPGPTMKNWLED